jgi:hypothetical protein
VGGSPRKQVALATLYIYIYIIKSKNNCHMSNQIYGTITAYVSLTDVVHISDLMYPWDLPLPQQTLLQPYNTNGDPRGLLSIFDATYKLAVCKEHEAAINNLILYVKVLLSYHWGMGVKSDTCKDHELQDFLLATIEYVSNDDPLNLEWLADLCDGLVTLPFELKLNKCVVNIHNCQMINERLTAAFKHIAESKTKHVIETRIRARWENFVWTQLFVITSTPQLTNLLNNRRQHILDAIIDGFQYPGSSAIQFKHMTSQTISNFCLGVQSSNVKTKLAKLTATNITISESTVTLLDLWYVFRMYKHISNIHIITTSPCDEHWDDAEQVHNVTQRYLANYTTVDDVNVYIKCLSGGGNVLNESLTGTQKLIVGLSSCIDIKKTINLIMIREDIHTKHLPYVTTLLNDLIFRSFDIQGCDLVTIYSFQPLQFEDWPSVKISNRSHSCEFVYQVYKGGQVPDGFLSTNVLHCKFNDFKTFIKAHF